MRIFSIDGTSCEEQWEKGIHNYYCFLRYAVEKGANILRNYGDINVYVSISNDHVAPAIALPYVKVNGTDILTDFKNRCSGCKFTNAMVVEQLNFDADNFWRDGSGNPYLYDKSTFDSLIRSYITHTTFWDMGLGVNAYAPGNCVNNSENGVIDLKIRFCDKYHDYLNSIDCKSNDICNTNKNLIINLAKIYGYGEGPDMSKKECEKDPSSPECPHVEFREFIIGDNICRAYIDDMNDNNDIDMNKLFLLTFNQKVCVDNNESCITNFGQVDPPISSTMCSGITQCKKNYYTKYLEYIRKELRLDTLLFISEIGSQSCEYSAYSQGSVFAWDKKRKMTVGIYGITNIRDYQEQVDMVEGDVMVFLGDNYLRSKRN